MLTPERIKPRGLLNPRAGEKHFQLSRYPPAPDLSFFVERYWIIHWDLRGRAPYVSENLPYPCVNLVVERQQSGIFGVVTGKFTHLLEGGGKVFGLKFRPGAFYPFLKTPVCTLTDTSVPIGSVFGAAGEALESAMLALEDHDAMIALAENFLRAHLPARDENTAFVNHVIDTIIARREINRVDDVVRLLDLNKRTLQRLFSQYVGVSPKWVIMRYRLHEAAEQVTSGTVLDWSRLALDLGYFDQAHFIKDFKSIVGKTPAEYASAINRETTRRPE